MDYLGNKKSKEVSKWHGKFAHSEMIGAVFFKKLHRPENRIGEPFSCDCEKEIINNNTQLYRHKYYIDIWNT